MFLYTSTSSPVVPLTAFLDLPAAAILYTFLIRSMSATFWNVTSSNEHSLPWILEARCPLTLSNVMPGFVATLSARRCLVDSLTPNRRKASPICNPS